MNITYYVTPAGTLTSTADEPTAAAVIYHGPGDWYVRIGDRRDCAILTGLVTPDLIRRRAVPYIADGLTTEAAVERVCAIVTADLSQTYHLTGAP